MRDLDQELPAPIREISGMPRKQSIRERLHGLSWLCIAAYFVFQTFQAGPR